MTIFEKLRAGVTTASADETRAVATEFAGALAPDTTLALHGNLGVGKTTFVQGLARGLGIAEPVTSPTFNIFTLHRGPINLLHLDAYRLETAANTPLRMSGEEFVRFIKADADRWREVGRKAGIALD